VATREQRLRSKAVARRLAGESPEAIARSLGRSRQWVARWVRRYDPADSDWAKERSCAPRQVANRTPGDVEAQVLAVRARLEANPWAQIGAEAIAWELEKLGARAPTTRTIERILKRAGVVRHSRRERPLAKGVPYPAPACRGVGDLHQADLVGPRHLDGGEPFIALNMVGSITDAVDLVVSDPVQAGTMAVMAVADTATFDLARQRGRRY